MSASCNAVVKLLKLLNERFPLPVDFKPRHSITYDAAANATHLSVWLKSSETRWDSYSVLVEVDSCNVSPEEMLTVVESALAKFLLDNTR